jgi:NTE family protein
MPTHHEIGLVLSGGGARCLAQVGALRAVEEAGFRVAAIAANSSAAIIGALYAAGHGASGVEAIVLDVDWAAFMDVDGATGLIGHRGVETLLADHAPATFEDLQIPLAVPTVDIERAELLVYRTGPLVPPVCASNAFPGLFTPVEFEGRFLMDGGILDNFPVGIIRTLTRRPVLALDVRPPARLPLDLDKPRPDSLGGKIAALLGHGATTAIKVVTQAYSITQSRLVELNCTLHPPDVWLRPGLDDDMGVEDFSRLEEAIEHGYRAVQDAIADGRFDGLTPRGVA